MLEAVRGCATGEDARNKGSQLAFESERKDWSDVKREALLQAVTLKFGAGSDVAAELLATGDKTIVCVDQCQWTGMSAAGGIPTGHNHLGECLMQARAGLRGAAASQ